MTAWEHHHHPPHDHPDFDAYLNTLTNDDLTTINTAMITTDNATPDARNDLDK